MSACFYDAGVLIAAERGDRAVWAEHRVRLEQDLLPASTAPVLAQASRDPRQVQLRRLLRGCLLEGFAPDHAHEVGALLGRSATTDVVDAHLLLAAARAEATVLTSDPGDLERLTASLPRAVPIRKI